MKIKKIAWQNYKGLVDGEICADGNDVVISGANGTGKSSIASVIPFVLFGKVTGSLRRYENGRDIPHGLIHSAEITFDTGLTARRELHDSRMSTGTITKLYLDGELVKKPQFDAEIMRITSNAGELAMNPFAFCEMSVKDQRALLLRRFGDNAFQDLINRPQNSAIAQMLGTKSPEAYIATCREELRKPVAELKSIPARIEEINRQITVPTADIAQLEAEAAQIKRELSTPNNVVERGHLLAAMNGYSYRIETAEREIKQIEEELPTLRDDWRRVKNSRPGKCPFCGQTIPVDQFTAKRDIELDKITRTGKKLAARRNDLLAEIETSRKGLAVTEEKLKAFPQVQDKARIEQLQSRLAQITEQTTLIKLARRQENRVAELVRLEKELNAQVADIERRMHAAEKFRLELINATEEQINSKFNVVKFKLFDYLKTTGEVKATCEATLRGVPYSALSKGEKLTAALDIFAALQTSYAVEMPLVIDDAESYTPLTLLSLPTNQLFLLKVTDSDLDIEINERR